MSAVAVTLTEAQLAAQVPACPLWTVRDLLGHLVGGCADLVSGNLDGAPAPGWTAAHIGRRSRDQIAAWDWHGPVGGFPVTLAVLDQTPTDLSD